MHMTLYGVQQMTKTPTMVMVIFKVFIRARPKVLIVFRRMPSSVKPDK